MYFVFTKGPPLKKRRIRKPVTDSSIEEFHDELKASVVLRQTALGDGSLPSTPEGREKQLEEFQASIQSNKRMETYIYCLIGRNLQKIKEDTGKKGKDFMQHVQHLTLTPYEKSKIYFMIDL
jgi:hypothetical protein